MVDNQTHGHIAVRPRTIVALSGRIARGRKPLGDGAPQSDDADLGTPVCPDDPVVETPVALISCDTHRHEPVHARAIVDDKAWPKPSVHVWQLLWKARV